MCTKNLIFARIFILILISGGKKYVQSCLQRLGRSTNQAKLPWLLENWYVSDSTVLHSEPTTNRLSLLYLASREKIQKILKQVGDKKDRNGDTTYCYTDAGLTGNETTCKESADQYCENIGLERPSKPYRDCRSACLGDCMAGNDCTFAADDAE